MDSSDDPENRHIQGMKKSYLAFDWKNESILMKATMFIDPSKLPPALRPMDADLAFDDIASQGVIIDERLTNPEDKVDRHVYAVTVTICTRRPPKFFIPVEVSNERYGGGGTKLMRRRGTAMDFAISGIVSSHLMPDAELTGRVNGTLDRSLRFQKALVPM